MSNYEDNNASNQLNESNIEDNDFDYLDSLMQDVMNHESTNTAPPASPVVVNQGKQEPANVNLSEGSQSNSESEDLVEVEAKVVKRRVPLFQQVGIDISGDKSNLSRDNNDDSEAFDDNLDPLVNQKEDKNKVKLGIDEDVKDEGSYSKPITVEVQEHVEPLKSESAFGFKVEVNVSPESNIEVIKEDSVNLASSKSSSNVHLEHADEDIMDDMFDGMFDDLTTDTEHELEVNKDLDSSVVVPLETVEMKDIKVTPDGRTLADMIPSMRGGRRTVDKVVADIKNQVNIIEVGDKKFSDNRYTKHIEVINEDTREQEERRALSKKFIQRNAKFTEQEKIIMKNLNVSNSQFTKILGSKELTKREKEELIGLGKYGAEKHFKGRKYRTTIGDTAMLEYLVKFKFANTRILRWISNEPQGRTWRKLNRLRDNGLVESQSLIGIPDLWGATTSGVAVSGYSFDPGLKPAPKMATISSTMGINYVAACLWFNTINVLNLDDFPAHNKIIALQEDGRDRVQGETLVSELEIRSSLGKEINPNSTTMKTLGDARLYDIISANVRTEIENWKNDGSIGEGPECSLGNEFMWILFPMSQLTLSYHVPDLVVKRERGPQGEPKSIAVEMERYEKSNDKYDKIMLAYKLDEHLYEKVIWITPNTRIARALEKAAVAVGFTRYSIIPIITETGTYKKQDIWMI